MEDIEHFVKDLFCKHRGKAWGALGGAVLAIAILLIGFWHVLFILCLVLIGLFIGSQVDEGKDVSGKINEYIDRVLQKISH